ncbi:MAG: hypothetical protein C4581_13810 [Nitrospiraceae bacterium]|nr:MAG: hypothetical protein C4581_13810 [Nitrospiraceae bacterium]
MKKLFYLTVLIITLLLAITAGYAYMIRYDGPYEGRIIDAETKQPIAGVVVLGVWYKEEPNVAGATSTFYDAKETVTDSKGEFKFPGLGIKIFSYVGTMNFVIFKKGYEYLGLWPWESLKEDVILNRMIRWEGDKAIILLKKLTMEERKKKGTPDFYIGIRYDERENIHHTCLPRNVKLLPEEVNKELIEQGREPYDLEGGRCEK